MDKPLDVFIRFHGQDLTDRITKQVLCDLPEWRAISLKKTIERIEKFLIILADSIRQDNPNFLITYLNSISVRRMKEGLSISALHGLMDISEGHIINLVQSAQGNEQDKKVYSGVIKNAMATARIAMSIVYIKKDHESDCQV